MQFGSDNIVGASQEILDALIKSNSGTEPSYGGDSIKKRVDQLFCDLFERKVDVFLVPTGTAANALSIAAMTPPWGMCISNEESHINGEECGAPEFYTQGAKLKTLKGEAGKLSARALDAYLASLPSASYQMPATSISISQQNECGQVYQLTEIKALCDIAKKYSLPIHMDGARFANALVALNCSPAEMTWKQGIDILSFGATKNGALAAEAVIVFKTELSDTLEYRRKRAGQTLSKGRFLSSQMEAYLKDNLWLKNARHANYMAQLLKQELSKFSDIRFPWKVEGNELFPILPSRYYQALQKAGAVFYEWPYRSVNVDEYPKENEHFVRIVTSFATQEDSIKKFTEILRKA